MAYRMQILGARADQQHVIANLLQLYLYEFSADQRTDVGSDGRYAWDGLDAYWAEDDLHPFLLTVGDQFAGFALVQRIHATDGTLAWDVEDFFVLAKYRRSGLGTFAANQLFRRFTGPWQVRVLASNDRAQRFWRSAISQHSALPPSHDETICDNRLFDTYRFET